MIVFLFLLNMFRADAIPLVSYGDTNGWNHLRPRLWREGWMPWGDRGWFSSTHDAALSSATIIHNRPPLEKNIFLNQMGFELHESGGFTVGEFDLRIFKGVLPLAGENQDVNWLSLIRGLHEHLLVMIRRPESDDVYEAIWNRTISSLRVMDTDALIRARTVFESNPKSLDGKLNLAENLRLNGRSDAALDHYRQTLTIDQGNMSAAIGLIRTLSHQGALPSEALDSIDIDLMGEAEKTLGLGGEDTEALWARKYIDLYSFKQR